MENFLYCDESAPSVRMFEAVEDFLLVPLDDCDTASTASYNSYSTGVSTPRLGSVYHEDFSSLFSSGSPSRLSAPRKIASHRKNSSSQIVDFLLEKARTSSKSSSMSKLLPQCAVTNDKRVFEAMWDAFKGTDSTCETGCLLEYESKSSCLHLIDDIEDDIELPSRCDVALITVSESLSGLDIQNDDRLFATAYWPIMKVCKQRDIPLLFVVCDGLTTFEINALAVPSAARLQMSPRKIGAIEMEDVTSFAKLLLFSREDLPSLCLPMESSLRAVLNLTSTFMLARHDFEWISNLMEDFVCDTHDREAIQDACRQAFDEEQARFDSFVVYSDRQPVTNRLELLEDKFDEMRAEIQESMKSPYCKEKMTHLQRVRSFNLAQTRDIDGLLQSCGDVEFEKNLYTFVESVENEWRKRFINLSSCEICIPSLADAIGEVFYLLNLQSVKCIDLIQVKCVFDTLEDAVFGLDYLTRRCGSAAVCDRICDLSYGPPTIDVYLKDNTLKVRTPWCVASILIHFVLMVDPKGDGEMLNLYEEWRDIERALYSKQHVLILSNERHSANAATKQQVQSPAKKGLAALEHKPKWGEKSTSTSTTKWEGIPQLGSHVKVKGATCRQGVVRFIGRLAPDDCMEHHLDSNEIKIGVSFARKLRGDTCDLIDVNHWGEYNISKYFGVSLKSPLNNLKYHYFVSVSSVVWCSQRCVSSGDIVPGSEVMILHSRKRDQFGVVHGIRYSCRGEKQVFVEVYDDFHRDIVVDGTIMYQCNGTGKIVNASHIRVMPALDAFASYADLVSMHCQRQRLDSLNVLMTPDGRRGTTMTAKSEEDEEEDIDFALALGKKLNIV